MKGNRSRYVGFLAFIATFLALTPYLLIKKLFKTFASLFAACAGGCLLFGLLTSVPVQSTADAFSQTASLFVAIFEGQQDTLESSRLKDFDASSVDSSTADWLERLRDNPFKAIATAILRTMLAPYPWVPFSEGLSGRGVELYYLSSTVFALCLPGTIWLFVRSAQRPTESIAFVALILGACLCAYVTFYGEWSTRQRVFMMPIYFGLATIGWDDLRRRMSYRRFNDARQLD